MTWAGVRGDGPRPCYSAERPRLDDAAWIAEPRAELGNGRGDRPDRACPHWRASLSPFAALPAVTTSREWGRERAAGGGGAGTIAAQRRGPAEGAWGCGTSARSATRQPARRREPRPPVLSRPLRAGPASAAGEENGAGLWVASSETLRQGSDRGVSAARRTLAASGAARSRGERFCQRVPKPAPRPWGPYLLLGGFFVLRFWVKAGSSAEKGRDGLQLWAARQSPGPWFRWEVSIQLGPSFGGQRTFLLRVTRW
ncbi:hypothetical protein H8959_011828 [Pygathrix nigripes]